MTLTPLEDPIRFTMVMQYPNAVVGYHVNNVNGTANALYEATFDMQRARGVECLTLRYEFVEDKPRLLLFAEVLESWKTSIESLVSLGHSLQRVNLALLGIDISCAEIVVAKTGLEEVLVRFGLDVWVEAEEEERENVRASFPTLDELGLLLFDRCGIYPGHMESLI